MTSTGPTPLELPPLSAAFRREFQKLFVRLKAQGLQVKDKVDRRVMAGELTYRDAWLVMADAADASDKAARVCNAAGKKAANGYLRAQAQDFCVPNTREHPLRAQLAFQREAHVDDHHAGRWPLEDEAGFKPWFEERAADYPVDGPRPSPAVSEDESSGLAGKILTLEKKLGIMRGILEDISEAMEIAEKPSKRSRAA